MQTIKKIFLLGLFITISACQKPKPTTTFEKIYSSQYSQRTSAQPIEIFQNHSELEAFWRSHDRNFEYPFKSINFDLFSVVGIFTFFNSGGSELEVERVKLTKDGIEVDANVIIGRSCITTFALTQPFVLIKITKTLKEPILNLDYKNIDNCQKSNIANP